MSTKSIHTGQGLKAALFSLPPGMPVTTAMMGGWGISRQLVHKYVKNGWLEALGSGYYRRPGDEITRNGAIAALNLQGAQLHIGGKTALAEQGSVHYLALGSQKLFLYSKKRTKLPQWFVEQFDCELRTTRLFGDEEEVPKRLQVRQQSDHAPYSPYLSSPERALLELLDEVPHRQSRDEAIKLMEPLYTLRSAVLQELLEACTRIKVKRLFFALAKELKLPVLQGLDRSRIDFGADSVYVRTQKGSSLILQHPGKQVDA